MRKIENRTPKYKEGSYLYMSGHKLKISKVEYMTCCFFYHLNCRCTRPLGIELNVGEDHLTELIQKNILRQLM